MKRFFYVLIPVFLFSCAAETKEENDQTAEEKSSEEETSGTSQEKENFETVKIGEIEFAKKNLDVTVYRNGDPIPQAKSNEEWKAFTEKKEGCWAYPDFDESKNASIGKVYSGYAVSDSRNLAPKGWKIPSSKDWKSVNASLGDPEQAAGKLKSTSGWEIPGDNSTGFNALPGHFFAGDFNTASESCYYWTSSETDTEYHDHVDIIGNGNSLGFWYDYDGWGMYIRCIKE